MAATPSRSGNAGRSLGGALYSHRAAAGAGNPAAPESGETSYPLRSQAGVLAALICLGRFASTPPYGRISAASLLRRGILFSAIRYRYWAVIRFAVSHCTGRSRACGNFRWASSALPMRWMSSGTSCCLGNWTARRIPRSPPPPSSEVTTAPAMINQELSKMLYETGHANSALRALRSGNANAPM